MPNLAGSVTFMIQPQFIELARCLAPEMVSPGRAVSQPAVKASKLVRGFGRGGKPAVCAHKT
jgi:hypothetical protein